MKPDIGVKLYNKTIFLPRRLVRKAKEFLADVETEEVRTSYHLSVKLQGLANDENKLFSPEFVSCYENIVSGDIFEVETTDGKVTKIVTRVRYSDKKDISIVVAKPDGRLFVKTAWLNNVWDTHDVLARSKYVTSPQSLHETKERSHIYG